MIGIYFRKVRISGKNEYNDKKFLTFSSSKSDIQNSMKWQRRIVHQIFGNRCKREKIIQKPFKNDYYV